MRWQHTERSADRWLAGAPHEGPASEGAAPRPSMVVATPPPDRFIKLVKGHWLDSIGNSVVVGESLVNEDQLTAVLSPLIDHPAARDTVLTIRRDAHHWRCGNARLEWADEGQQRLVWVTEDGRRSVWSRTPEGERVRKTKSSAFPWLLNDRMPEAGLPLDVPADILHDGARIAALLDIRQMIGPRSEPQERMTHILMDHDLSTTRRDYLIPGPESPLWNTLPVDEGLLRDIKARIHRIPLEALSQRVSWSGDTEIHVGHHKINARRRDIEVLESRWALPVKDPRKSLEIARLLALYSVFDNPLSNRRNGVHLGLDPGLRRQCDYELFASPLNAAVANGRYASKWPHVEWRFGSIGSYPTVLSILPVDSVVCVNPPFTEAYLADVMGKLAELKLRFRLRLAVPIQEVPWRKKLLNSLPSAELLTSYYDASSEQQLDILHPTLLWEDPRCPPRLPTANGTETYRGGTEHASAAGQGTLPPTTQAAVELLLKAAEPVREGDGGAGERSGAASQQESGDVKGEPATETTKDPPA